MNVTFETIWKKYVHELQAFLLSRVDEHALVDDLLQEVALKAFVAFDSGRVVKHERAYLYRIAKHVLIDYVNKSSKKPANYPLEPEEIAELNEHSGMHCLQSMLAVLKPNERDALRMQALEGYSERDIAKHFELSLEGARSRIKRAKKRLRQAYEQCCEIERNHKNEVIDLVPKEHNSVKTACQLCAQTNEA